MNHKAKTPKTQEKKARGAKKERLAEKLGRGVII